MGLMLKLWCLTPLSTIFFSHIVPVSFISGRYQSTRRKPQTFRKWLTNFITCEVITGHTRRRKAKQNYNTICLGYHYTQTNTNNIIKTCDLLQAIGGKDEPNIVLCGNRYGHHNALRPTPAVSISYVTVYSIKYDN
jgi:hypothetical protein